MIFVGTSDNQALIPFVGPPAHAWNITSGTITDELLIRFGAGSEASADEARITEQPAGSGYYVYALTVGETIAANAGKVFLRTDVAAYDNGPPVWEELVDQAIFADAVWGAILEDSHTAADLLRLLVSFAAGKVQNFSTGTLAFRNLADTVTRFTIVRSALGRISSTINNLLP